MEITEKVNEILRKRGEPGTIIEKKLGIILTSLNLTNRTRTNSGYVLWLNREIRKEIHSLARKHGMKNGPSSELAAKCDFCRAASENPANGATNKPAQKSGRVEADASDGEGRVRRERVKAKRRKPSRSARALRGRACSA